MPNRAFEQPFGELLLHEAAMFNRTWLGEKTCGPPEALEDGSIELMYPRNPEDPATSSHKGVLDGGQGCPLSTHLGTKRHPL